MLPCTKRGQLLHRSSYFTIGVKSLGLGASRGGITVSLIYWPFFRDNTENGAIYWCTSNSVFNIIIE